jgi:hypothetical protein
MGLLSVCTDGLASRFGQNLKSDRLHEATAEAFRFGNRFDHGVVAAGLCFTLRPGWIEAIRPIGHCPPFLFPNLHYKHYYPSVHKWFAIADLP